MTQFPRVLLWAVMATTALSVVECTCHEQGSDQGKQWGLHAGSAMTRAAAFTQSRGGRAGKVPPALTMTGYRSILYGAYMHASSDVCPDPKSRCYTCMRLHLCNRETLGLVTYMYRTVALWRGK